MKTKKINLIYKGNKLESLANYLGCDPSVIKIGSPDNCNFSFGNEEYFVLTDIEANEKVREYIKDSIWAFNAEFIIDQCGLDYSGAESLQEIQAKSCEDCNAFLLSLIEKTCGLDDFIDSAIDADGRGHFLSSYDREENEEGEYFIYRTN